MTVPAVFVFWLPYCAALRVWVAEEHGGTMTWRAIGTPPPTPAPKCERAALYTARLRVKYLGCFPGAFLPWNVFTSLLVHPLPFSRSFCRCRCCRGRPRVLRLCCCRYLDLEHCGTYKIQSPSPLPGHPNVRYEGLYGDRDSYGPGIHSV